MSHSKTSNAPILLSGSPIRDLMHENNLNLKEEAEIASNDGEEKSLEYTDAVYILNTSNLEGLDKNK